ncbi:MAG: hypothetical protein ACK5V3_16735, partial [Bdellovibrionales bacterium]
VYLRVMDMIANQNRVLTGLGLLVFNSVNIIQKFVQVFSLGLIVKFGMNYFSGEMKISRSFKVLLFHVNRVTARFSPAQNLTNDEKEVFAGNH